MNRSHLPTGHVRRLLAVEPEAFRTSEQITHYLAQRRIELGLSGPDLVRRIHVNVTTLYNWENAKFYPSLPHLIVWAEALGVSTPELLHTFAPRPEVHDDQD